MPIAKGKRIGIIAGSFNPVHTGHITFALQAMEAALLDKIYFMPERRPRHKPGVEHFAHRVGMLNKALLPHPQFDVLEMVDISFSIERTLPRLQRQFPDCQLVFLFGSDTALEVPGWSEADRLFKNSEFVIGLRQQDSQGRVSEFISRRQHQPRATYVFDSFAPAISSREVREALYQRQPAPGLLSSVQRYSNRHWLYVSLAG